MNRQELVYGQERRQSSRQVKTALMVGVIAFGITLAMVIGNRLSSTAASVIVGAVAGVVASIPVTFLLLMLIGNRGRSAAGEQEAVHSVRMPGYSQQEYAMYYNPPMPSRQAMQPQTAAGMLPSQSPVIVVTPPADYAWRGPGPQQPGGYYGSQMPVLSPAPREFQVIGEPGFYADGEWSHSF